MSCAFGKQEVRSHLTQPAGKELEKRLGITSVVFRVSALSTECPFVPGTLMFIVTLT